MSNKNLSMYDLPPVPYFWKSDYLRGDFEEGTLVTRYGTRVIVLPQELLVALHRAIEYETGRAWSLVTYTCGRRWGSRFLKTLQREWREAYRQQAEHTDFNVFESWISQYFEFQGWGQLGMNFQYEQYGVIEFKLKNSVLDLLLKDHLDSKYLNEIFAGFIASLATWLAGRELEAIEIASEHTGSDHSRICVALPARVEAARRARARDGSVDDVLAALMERTN